MTPLEQASVAAILSALREAQAENERLREALEAQTERANALGSIVLACIEAGHVKAADAHSLAAPVPADEAKP